MLYMVTFTINIPPMLAYIPYMDPMGYELLPSLEISGLQPDPPNTAWQVPSDFGSLQSLQRPPAILVSLDSSESRKSMKS